MVLQWHIVRLQLKETFSISYGQYDYRDALIVQLTHAGQTGYGECTALIYYGIDLKHFEQLLLQHQKAISNFGMHSPPEFYALLTQWQLPNFLKSALDCAYWDLMGKLEKRSFLDWNAISTTNIPHSSWTISVDNASTQIAKMKASQWPTFKVKCHGFQREQLAQLMATDFSFALDTNASWTPDDCMHWTQLSNRHRVRYVEQPMPIGVGNYQRLSKEDGVIWMADEEAQNEIDLPLLANHYSAVNVKVMKCGGLTPALAMIKAAKAMDFKVMIGCMTESTIGISAGAVLAPMCDYADLDGSNLIANDIATGTSINAGVIELSTGQGLGIRWK
ncbi:enolase C-terminal domain-like protein [Flavobacterium sp.]|uniref:enolase C-terminal domain-like protein n=1 Tax=Flavobacterium sp. TaxID=239 RepID=UPI00262AC875|nr:enolase C-terminal domain-like protein [Flavobacterium sp.]